MLKRKWIWLFIIICTAVAILGSTQSVKAENTDVSPIVKYDFEEVNGKQIPNTGANTNIGAATIHGAGEIVTDAQRGKVFYNHSTVGVPISIRTNYLQLDENIFKEAITKDAFTVSMWMRFDAASVDINKEFRWADIFVAYDKDGWGKLPMTKLGVNLIGRVNNTLRDDRAYFDMEDKGDYLADNQWHYIVFSVSEKRTNLYVDGEMISNISFNDTPGRFVGDLFTHSKNLIDMICIGGNSLWNDDPDMVAYFDDICIYDTELSKQQMQKEMGYVSGGVSFDGQAVMEGKAIEYTIDTTVINSKEIVSYEWYVGKKLVSQSKEPYVPTEKDVENIITLKLRLANGGYAACSGYCSIFPVLYIESDTDYYDIQRDYVTVDFALTGKDYKDSQLYDGEAEIKLRGNSTAGLDKRPFKVKLAKKTDVFGMGENKHWVLLANAIDVSLVRNMLLQELAGNLGLDYMESKFVSLMYNGEYYGVYELSEHVRVDETRINIYDWEEALEDSVTDLPEQMGGVLMEMDFYALGGEEPPNLLTAYSLPIYINTPEDTKDLKPLVAYMDEYVQAMEYALHSTDFFYENGDAHYAVEDQGWFDWERFQRVNVSYREDAFYSDKYDGWHYTQFVDLNSAINNMLVCEFSLNWDSMKNSFFMYKDVDGKIIFGPTWDFDWAWGNSMGQDTNAPETWQTTNEWFANEQYYQTVQWNRLFIRDPYFIVRLYERYHEVRDAYIAPIVTDKVAELKTENRVAGLANVERWNGAFNATAGQTYDEQLRYIQRFLNKRLTWLDEQFSDVDTLIQSLGYYVTSDVITTESCDTTSEPGYTILTVKVTDESIARLMVQVNGVNRFKEEVVDGIATIKIPDDYLEYGDGVLNVVQYRALEESGAYIINKKGTDKGNYENAISNYYTFTKAAEESVGDIDKNEEPPVPTVMIIFISVIVLVLVGAGVISYMIFVKKVI